MFDMRRREFITLLGGVAAAWPLAASAQDLTVPLIGFLNSASPGPFARLVDAFRQGLREGGYVEGRNVRIEYRWAEGQFARLPELAADLVHRRVSLIVATGGTVSARAAKEATATIPILFIVGPNPIGDGLVTSLNRPGGNATGVALYTSELLPKRLELLEKLLPRAARIAVLVNPSDAALELETKYVEDAMRVTGQQMVLLKASAERLRTGARLRCPAAGRCTPGQRRPVLHAAACSTRGARGTPRHTRRLSVARVYRRWWADELWPQHRGGVPSDWAVCQPHPER
jgi:putative ABC transport system substrate-binding protein